MNGTENERLTTAALKALLKGRDWTARDLAERVPCTPHHIRYCLRGERTMSKVMSMRVRSLGAGAKPVQPTKADGDTL